MTLRQAAKGMACQIRLPNICNFDKTTTVLCHMNGGGMGMKKHDIFAAIGCFDCHNEVDGRTLLMDRDLVKLYFYEGVFKTQELWLKTGGIKIGKE